MHGQAVHEGDRAAFYRAALCALRFVDAREGRGRRFGRDADAVWREFRGEMGASERIDLLLRDADTEWPRAFAPRVVFGLGGLADDEPFGPAWAGLESGLGEELWQASEHAVRGEVGAVVRAMVEAWGHAMVRVEAPVVTPTSRLVVAGMSAIAGMIEVFAPRGDLSWTEQVLVVASRPSERQLSGVASAILSAGGPTQVVRPHERPERSFAQAELVISKDADDEARAAAHLIQGGK